MPGTGSLEQVRRFVRQVQMRAVLLGIGVGIGLSALSEPVGYGFLAGVGISLINFKLMSTDAFDMVGKTPKGARSFIAGRFIIRFVIMFGFLAIIASRTNFNVVSAFAGLLFVQVVLVAAQVYRGLKASGHLPGRW